MSNAKEELDGGVKYGWKSFSQKRSLSMGARVMLPILFGDIRLDEVELSKVPHKYSASVTICVNKMVPAGRHRHLQVELKLKFFWRQVERLKVKEEDSRCNADGPVKKLGARRRRSKWKWMEKCTAQRSWISAKERSSSICQMLAILRICPWSSLLHKRDMVAGTAGHEAKTE